MLDPLGFVMVVHHQDEHMLMISLPLYKFYSLKPDSTNCQADRQ